jgi:hypothetical protein
MRVYLHHVPAGRPGGVNCFTNSGVNCFTILTLQKANDPKSDQPSFKLQVSSKDTYIYECHDRG